jgi:hypothetical protein
MADTFPLTVGPETFPLERQLLESPALRGSVLAELPLLPAGSTASVPRSAALFSLMLSHLRGGPLPSDVVTLRDLYVESAFYRLEGLRDAIEATLLGGGGGGGGGGGASATGSRPGDALVAAAGAIGRASALRSVITAAEAAAAAAAAAPPPRKPTASAQTSPPEKPKYRGGLSTAAYVGGEWRQLYAAPAAQRRDAVLQQPAGDGEAGQPMTPSRAAFLSLQRAAAATALPDPFGFCRRRAAAEAAPAAAAAPPPQAAPPQPPLSGLSASIRALGAPSDARACATTMGALDAVMMSSGGRGGGGGAGGAAPASPPPPPQQQELPLPRLHTPAAMRAPPPTLSPSKAGVNAGAVAAARALLAALEEGAPDAALAAPSAPLPARELALPPPPQPPTPPPPPPQQQQPQSGRGEEGVDGLLRALSAIRSATGETAAFLSSLSVGMGRRLREEEAAAAVEEGEDAREAAPAPPTAAASSDPPPEALADAPPPPAQESVAPLSAAGALSNGEGAPAGAQAALPSGDAAAAPEPPAAAPLEPPAEEAAPPAEEAAPPSGGAAAMPEPPPEAPEGAPGATPLVVYG